jgi:hypothetical protein
MTEFANESTTPFRNPSSSAALQAAAVALEATFASPSDQNEYADWPIRVDMEAGDRKIRSVMRIEAAVGKKPWDWLSDMHIRD